MRIRSATTPAGSQYGRLASASVPTAARRRVTASPPPPPSAADRGRPASGEPQPHSISARSSSARSSSSTCDTPRSPATASPHSTGRPTATAVAPSAHALTTSVPRRIPPSTSSGSSPPTASAIAGSRSTAAGTVSSWRPPWLDTTSASTPAETASRASWGCATPFSAIGSAVAARSHSTCSHDSSPVKSNRRGGPSPSRMFSQHIPSGSSAKPWRRSRSRRPKTGESTVTTSAAQPAASARRTTSAVKPRSGWM